MWEEESVALRVVIESVLAGVHRVASASENGNGHERRGIVFNVSIMLNLRAKWEKFGSTNVNTVVKRKKGSRKDAQNGNLTKRSPMREIDKLQRKSYSVFPEW